MARKPIQKKQVIESTGHEWDGIRELNTPMPRWWVWTFYMTIIWGIGYLIAMPAIPLVHEATPGLLKHSSRFDVRDDIAAVNAMNAPLDSKINSLELAAIAGDNEVGAYAINGGRATFQTFCIQCHGSGAEGSKGYPSLLDDDWLWGGDIDAIYTTIKHGIRSDDDDDSRLSDMPAFGDDYLSSEQIASVAQYVLSLSGAATDAALVADGAVVFEEDCAACHGEDAKGGRDFGAPNLTDAVWLYAGDLDTVIETITYSRYGVMPAWAVGDKLSETQIRQVAVYVHQLGGGE